MANTPNIVRAVGNQLGTTLNAGISASASSITLVDATGFSADGGYIIIDENITGKEEIIYIESLVGSTLAVATDGRGRCGTGAVTHDAGATVSDILVDEHVNGVADKFRIEHEDDGTHSSEIVLDTPTINTPVINTPTLVLANSSPTADGSMGFDRTDEDLQIGDGSVSQAVHMGAWTSFDPTISNITLGTGGTKVGYYSKIGKVVVGRIMVTLGTSGVLTGVPQVTLPVTIITANLANIGSCTYADAGSQTYLGYLDGFGTFRTYYIVGSYLVLNNITATAPFTWTATDIIYANFTYEAA